MSHPVKQWNSESKIAYQLRLLRHQNQQFSSNKNYIHLFKASAVCIVNLVSTSSWSQEDKLWSLPLTFDPLPDVMYISLLFGQSIYSIFSERKANSSALLLWSRRNSSQFLGILFALATFLRTPLPCLSLGDSETVLNVIILFEPFFSKNFCQKLNHPPCSACVKPTALGCSPWIDSHFINGFD